MHIFSLGCPVFQTGRPVLPASRTGRGTQYYPLLNKCWLKKSITPYDQHLLFFPALLARPLLKDRRTPFTLPEIQNKFSALFLKRQTLFTLYARGSLGGLCRILGHCGAPWWHQRSQSGPVCPAFQYIPNPRTRHVYFTHTILDHTVPYIPYKLYLIIPCQTIPCEV